MSEGMYQISETDVPFVDADVVRQWLSTRTLQKGWWRGEEGCSKLC